MIAVHGPHTWGQPFFAQTDVLVVNLLGPNHVEVKSLVRSDVQGSDSEYEWDFGDATPHVVNGYEVTHTYSSPGQKVITVKISTTTGLVTKSITINLPTGVPLGELLQAPHEIEEDQDKAA